MKFSDNENFAKHNSRGRRMKIDKEKAMLLQQYVLDKEVHRFTLEKYLCEAQYYRK